MAQVYVLQIMQAYLVSTCQCTVCPLGHSVFVWPVQVGAFIHSLLILDRSGLPTLQGLTSHCILQLTMHKGVMSFSTNLVIPICSMKGSF